MPDVTVASGDSCPHCGAQNQPGLKNCWLCHGSLIPPPSDVSVGQPGMPPVAPPEPVAVRSFGLDSLMLGVTLICVCFGMFAIAPGLGIFFAIAAAPAAVRTIVLVRGRVQKGQTATTGEKAVFFAGSLAIVVMAGVAAGVAFFAACWGGFFGGMAVGQLWEKGDYGGVGTGMLTGVSLGGLVGLFVFIMIVRRSWPSKE